MAVARKLAVLLYLRCWKRVTYPSLVAVARKLAVLLYRLWQTQRPFEAYPAAGSAGLAA